MKVCVLIPAYNEARAIGPLVEHVRQKGLDVVVIDDGSSDDTGLIARDKGAQVIVHPEKKGKGASLRDGFCYVLAKDYIGLITMDGDGQHAVEDLDSILEKAREHPDSVVTGNRMADTSRMPLIRIMTNFFMSGLISLLCRQSIPDTQCGYRYIGRKILETIQITAKDYEIESEVLIQASKKGFKVFSVPIQTIYQGESSKINPLKDTIRFFIYLGKELRR